MTLQTFCDLLSHSKYRVQRGHRILEDHGYQASPDMLQLGDGHSHHVLAAHLQLITFQNSGGRVHQSHNGQCCCGFSCTGLSHQSQGFPFFYMKAYIIAGLVERYVNLGDCYDRAGLQPLRQELMGCMKGYKACYQRAYRCLTAAAQIGEDLRSLLLTPALEAKMAKRARGILSREVKKGDGEAGRAVQRFLGGVTWKGVLCQFETVDALCKRVYELADTYGLAHSMLTHLAAGALASGHDVIVCPSPLFPDRMEHLLIPSLSLAFVSASPSLPYPKRPYRRIRLDAMADAELLRRNKARLKFSRKVSAALVEEAVDSLAQAKAMHDELEGLYNPHVDFDRVYQTAQAITDELTARL